MWPNFDGKPYTREQLAAHINSCDFSNWKHKNGSRGKPSFITLHNTSVPDMRTWLAWSPAKRQQYIQNMQPYYEQMGWLGGPHFFVPPQSDICAFGFNDLMSAGTHASCFNDISIGIEMVGEFEREAFDSGPGAIVADNAIYLMALLHNKIGLTPTPYVYKQKGLHFHVECTADHHNCPGAFVHKPDIVARVAAKMAELAGPAPVVAPAAAVGLLAAAAEAMPTAPLSLETVHQICAHAAASPLAHYHWNNRGAAPLGYIKGMATVFGAVYAKWKAGDPAATAMAAASTGANGSDALAWYDWRFGSVGMSNAAAGADTLRHLFVLLIGLGMRESSGRYCEGRDRSADNTTADTAEAGLFQMSWNAHTASPLIPQLFAQYSANPDGFLAIFQEGVTPTHGDLANYGDGDGAAFQKLCKTCPAFAAEAAAVGLRVLRTHWGPINARAAEVRPEADALLKDVQALVDAAGQAPGVAGPIAAPPPNAAMFALAAEPNEGLAGIGSGMGAGLEAAAIVAGVGVDPAVAIDAGRLLTAAYSMYHADPENKTPQPGADFPSGYRLLAWVQMRDFLVGSLDPTFYGFIAENRTKPGQCIMAIRGTSNGIEWWDDAMALIPRPFKDYNCGLVGDGFLRIYQTLEVVEVPPSTSPTAAMMAPTSLRDVGDFNEQVFDLITRRTQLGPVSPFAAMSTTSIFVAGHSLGSALATLYAMENTLTKKISNLSLCVFASPRVGNGAFAKAFNQLRIPSWNIINTSDLVPKLPPSLLGFEHVDTIQRLDGSGIAVSSLECQHALPTYMHLIDHSIPLDAKCKVGANMAMLLAAAEVAPPPQIAIPAEGWTIAVQRRREEYRPGEGFRRTVGTYQVYHNGAPIAALSGWTVERQGPGDNGLLGKREHRCITRGLYPLNSHAMPKYKTQGYRTDGEHPRPAIEVGNTDRRDGILIHPADGYGSTIGCINLSGPLPDENADIVLSESLKRVIAAIDDLKVFKGGALPAGNSVPIGAAWLVVNDAPAGGGGAGAHVAGAGAMLAAGLPPDPAPASSALEAAAMAETVSASPHVIDCDVVIQAGHEGTPDGMTGGQGPLGNEIDWTPIVANEAVRLLKLAGVNAVKETARIKVTRQKYRCKLALFLHFDDPGVAAESGPSVGYRHSSDQPAASEWKALYKEFFPFNEKWHSDNYTRDEEFYYGFAYTATSDAEFLIEFGDLHSLRQAQWLKPRLAWLGSLVAHYVSKRIGMGNIPKPAAFAAPAAALAAALEEAKPVGISIPFTTKPSPSGNKNGSSSTSGLRGMQTTYDDGTIVIEATESLRAERTGGWHGTLIAFQRRVEKDGKISVEQSKYAYSDRTLPAAILLANVGGIPPDVPPSFTATETQAVVASQFGKNDREDEGTGSPDMGLVQTNSEVFGASVKQSVMRRVFGNDWRKNSKRFEALIEVYHPATHKMVRVPLVDIGPGERIKATVDLCWACDQFLGTRGQADVEYRILVPSP